MKSRMDKYYDSNENKARTAKNQQLYRTIYEQAEYSNVEGISIIEKNEKIDIDMIKELINKNNNISRIKQTPVEVPKQEIEEDFDDDRSYDIRDVLSKAKDSRVVDNKRISDTQYNILKGINIKEQVNVPEDIKTDDLKGMIDAISANSKSYTTNLLDDLKSIYDATMHEQIQNKVEEEKVSTEIDKSFYTNTMGFKEEDFEDLKDFKEDVEQNSILTKILICVLFLVVFVGIVFLVFHFIK